MVGGTIIGMSIRADHSWGTLNVQGDGCERNDTRSVIIKPRRKDTGEKIRPAIGDQVWWQSGTLFWTPSDHSEIDVPVELVSHT
jgi:hypothetical protein